MQVQTKRRQAFDLTDSSTILSVTLWIMGFFTVCLFPSLHTLVHFFSHHFHFFVEWLIFHPLLLLWMPSLSGTFLQPLWKARLIPGDSFTVWKAFMITPMSASSPWNTSFYLKCSFCLWKASLALNVTLSEKHSSTILSNPSLPALSVSFNSSTSSFGSPFSSF